MTQKIEYTPLPFAPCIIHVTGPPDSGKTTFGLTAGYPANRICLIDDDIKGQTDASQLAMNKTSLGHYVNLVRVSKGLKEVEFHDAVMNIINQIKPGDFDVIFFDTFTRFEKTFQPKVVSNPYAFKSAYSPMGPIKGAEQWIASFEYEAQVLDSLLEKAPVIILSSHLKFKTIGGVRSQMFTPECMKPVVQKSLFRVWLEHAPHKGGAPDGLVLKRVGKLHEVPGYGVQRLNVLPRKLSPCTWTRIRAYWDDPLGDREPEAHEVPNADEIANIEGHLTKFHKWALELEAAAQAEAKEQENQVAAGLEKQMKDRVFTLFDEGKTIGDVVQELADVDAKMGLRWQKEWRTARNNGKAKEAQPA